MAAGRAGAWTPGTVILFARAACPRWRDLHRMMMGGEPGTFEASSVSIPGVTSSPSPLSLLSFGLGAAREERANLRMRVDLCLLLSFHCE